jgi:hypothetical protein
MRYGATAAALVALLAALPAAAQLLPVPWTPLPHPTDSGKPVIFDPQFSAKAENDRRLGCAPGSQCRWQLLGVIQNNGAIELRATALTW